MSGKPEASSSGADLGAERYLAQVGQAVSSLRFGSVLVIVQDGRVVQIDKTEKVRLDPRSRSAQWDQADIG